jgi:hypothetical protein
LRQRCNRGLLILRRPYAYGLPVALRAVRVSRRAESAQRSSAHGGRISTLSRPLPFRPRSGDRAGGA